MEIRMKRRSIALYVSLNSHHIMKAFFLLYKVVGLIRATNFAERMSQFGWHIPDA